MYIHNKALHNIKNTNQPYKYLSNYRNYIKRWLQDAKESYCVP